MVRNDCITRFVGKILIAFIKIYQVIFAKLIYPNCCKFYPSCSSYCIEAIENYGIIKGLYYCSKRILSCNPWNKKYGYDPVKKLNKITEDFDKI